MKYAFLLFTAIIFCYCGEDTGPAGNPGDPTNLEFDVINYNDGSGTVVLQATADSATEYHFFMDDGDPNPIVNSSGSLEYVYEITGLYTIEVRAYGSSGRFLKKSKTISVDSESPVDVGEGYSTPLSYPGMELVWQDEFNGNELDDAFWCHDIGTGCPDLCGWGNNELEYYREENTWLEDGLLIIEARDDGFAGSNYTSGKIVTRNKQSFHFGRIDIRATLPVGQGIWPALWLLGVNQPAVGWPKCGEIDIMEMIGGNGRENTVSANAFWDSNGVADNPRLYTLDQGIFADEFHVFSLVWDENELNYFVDDEKYHTLNISSGDLDEFQKQFYMIFNVAVGGNWPGSPDETTNFPTRMYVDYVRAFRNL